MKGALVARCMRLPFWPWLSSSTAHQCTYCLIHSHRAHRSDRACRPIYGRSEYAHFCIRACGRFRHSQLERMKEAGAPPENRRNRIFHISGQELVPRAFPAFSEFPLEEDGNTPCSCISTSAQQWPGLWPFPVFLRRESEGAGTTCAAWTAIRHALTTSVEHPLNIR